MTAEMLLYQVTNVLCNQGLVFFVGEPVIEDTKALIPPHPHHTPRALVMVGQCLGESVVDSGQVSEIENVVEFRGSGWEVMNYVFV